MHITQRGRDSPQALFAHDLVVTARDFDAPGLRIDAIRAGVRHPELEGLIHAIERSPDFTIGAGQRPLGQGCDVRSLPRLRGGRDLERLHSSSGAEEPQQGPGANLEAERRRCVVHQALRNAWMHARSLAQNQSNRLKLP